MTLPSSYRASVVNTTPEAIEYDNGVTLPRGRLAWADDEAGIFEGQRAMPQAPLGGYGASAPIADAGTGAAFNQAQQGLPQAADVTPTWGANAAAMGDRIAAPPRYAPMEGSQGLGAPTAPAAGDAGFRVPTTQDFARYGQGEAPPDSSQRVGFVPPQTQPQAPVGGGVSVRSNTTTSTQHGVPIDPTLLTDLNYQSARAELAIGDRAEAARVGAENMSAHRTEIAAQQQELERTRQVAEQKRQERMRTSSDEYRRAVEAFEKKTVDPNHFYSSRGTAGTIIAAIAMGLGAFSSAMTGGKNEAVGIIQSAIADDIDAQKENLSNQKAGLQERNNLLADMRARFGDERSAELATESALLRRAQTQAEALEAQARAAGTLPEGELASAQLAIMGDERLAELQNRSADRVTTQTQTARSSGGGGRSQGRQGRGATPAETREYSDRRQKLETARASVERLRTLVAANPNDIPGVGATSMVPRFALSADGRAVQAELQNLVQRQVQAVTGATATPEQTEAMRAYVGGAGTDEDLRAGLSRVEEDLAEAERNLDAGFSPDVIDEYQARGGRARFSGEPAAPATFRRAGQ